MNEVVMGRNGISALSIDEIDTVSGGADARMIATGLATFAGGLLLAECPPAAAAVMTLGVHIIAAGMASGE
jgi:hypothetical protein